VLSNFDEIPVLLSSLLQNKYRDTKLVSHRGFLDLSLGGLGYGRLSAGSGRGHCCQRIVNGE
jgi:hypothetical protein